MHDTREYENSELGRTLPDKFACDYVVIAYLAYPLSNYLLKSSREKVQRRYYIVLYTMLKNHPLIR
jgi:hypothetical protein